MRRSKQHESRQAYNAQAMGFRQFPLRGIKKVQGEWGLVMRAFNCRRLHKLARA